MGGINMINKRRANIQKLGRQRKAASKSSSVLRHRQSIVDGTISQSTIAAMPLNAQQIRALRSNPQANVKLSKKKQRKVLRDARLEQRDRAAKLGLAVEKEMGMTGVLGACLHAILRQQRSLPYRPRR